jgi:zinc protease
VFAGTIDERLMKTLAETYLASVPAGKERFDTWAGGELPVRPVKDASATLDKAKEDRSSVYEAWIAPKKWELEPSFACQVLTEYLNIQMDKNIREKLGGVYSAGVSISMSISPTGEISLGLSFSCDPARLEDLCTAAEAELAKAAAGNIDATDFANARLSCVKSLETSMQRDSYVAQIYLNYNAWFNLDEGIIDKRPAIYETITAADCAVLAKEVLAAPKVRVVLNPEDK